MDPARKERLGRRIVRLGHVMKYVAVGLALAGVAALLTAVALILFG